MSKKNIAAIVCSGLLIGLCLGSPMVMSELQNKNVVDKMRFEKKEKVYQKKTKLTLFEKIELYRNSQQTGMKVPPGGEEVSQEHVINVVEREWMRLYQRGFLASPPNENCLKNVKYYVETYMNEQYDFVTVWQVYMGNEDGSERFEAKIEEESGKIIDFYHSIDEDYKTYLYKNKYPNEYDESDRQLEEWLSEIWSEYIDTELVGSHMEAEEIGWQEERVFSYSDGVSDAEYQISVYPNTMVVRLK